MINQYKRTLKYNIIIYRREKNLNNFVGYSHGQCCAARAVGC
jgi:hypothetical protein